MAATIENAFLFDPRPEPGVNMVDFADTMAMSNSSSGLFDDAFMARVPFSSRPQSKFDVPPKAVISEEIDTVHSQHPLGQSKHRISRENTLPNAPKWGTDESDAPTERVTRNSQTPKQTRTPIRSPPKVEDKLGASYRSKGRSTSVRGRPKKKFTDAEEVRKKREQNLEKNRIAANKCRERKKDWVARMEDRHRDLAARNGFLKAEVNSLGNTVLELKELALQHVECGYAPIQEYIKGEADRVQGRTRSRTGAWPLMSGLPPRGKFQPQVSLAFSFSDGDSNVFSDNDPRMRASHTIEGGATAAIRGSMKVRSMSTTSEGNGTANGRFAMLECL